MMVLGALGLLVAVAAAVTLTTGDYPLSLGQVWGALTGGGERVEQYVVLQVRLPRLAMALLVGAALGAAGAILQSLLRNPLASPELLGISGGASLAAVFALLTLGITGPALPAIAFAGGLAASLLLLAAARGRAAGYRLILAGIGLAFFTAALIAFLMTRAQLQQTQSAVIWLTGTLSSTPWWQVAVLAVVWLAALPALYVSGRWLPILALGPDAAAGLGVRPGLARLVAVVVAVLLTAVPSAFAGPIAFVALCAPAIARPLIGHGSTALAPGALVGAVLLVFADLIAQFAIPGVSMPVGVVTGALGAVFLLWLLATSKGRTL
jgi:iron complex transport system permease protein